MKKTVVTPWYRMSGMRMVGVAMLLMTGLYSSTHAASFDCKKAGTRIEKMICGDSKLSDMDDELGIYYAPGDDVAATDPRRVAQRAWLAKRNACTTAACVENQYHLRLSQLACAPDAPFAGATHTQISCLSHQLWVAEKELDAVERQHIDEISKDAHNPEGMRALAVKEAKTWRVYRAAKCELYGNREGDGGNWQVGWALGCDVSETEQRIKAIKAD
ncbi:lysozyme inhibitor LprI family protein [Roseateles chitinivorans]|uniref:lysozyme inhibitor LprI family protein n=1 Tax=Roseateles chitinivorans TaxID=2917965 RepID=UPI003D67D4C6